MRCCHVYEFRVDLMVYYGTWEITEGMGRCRETLTQDTLEKKMRTLYEIYIE
jgi:hypothetical protein